MSHYYIDLDVTNSGSEKIELNRSQIDMLNYDNNVFDAWGIAICSADGTIEYELLFASSYNRDEYKRLFNLVDNNGEWIESEATIVCDHSTFYEWIPCKLWVDMEYCTYTD